MKTTHINLSQDLHGKVVLVTGAGKGLGHRVALALAARGAQLAINDISPINLDETATQIRAAGGLVSTYVEDIAKKMPVQALLNRVQDNSGRIDLLIHCAEVEPQKSILEMDDWDWQRVIDVNLGSAFLLIQSTGRIMKAQGGGTIILTGTRPHARTGRAAYFASKAGLKALARAAAVEFSACNVRLVHADSLRQVIRATFK